MVRLTRTEFALLAALDARLGAVVSRAELLTDVWGYAPDLRTRTVDEHVWQVRHKLREGLGIEPAIDTIHRVGYRLRPQAHAYPPPVRPGRPRRPGG